jgi:hypothetical protein
MRYGLTLLAILMCVSCSEQKPMSTIALLRGHSVMVLRLPTSSGQFREDILIEDNDRTDNSAVRRLAVRGPSDATLPGVDMTSYRKQQVSEPLWSRITSLRAKWCNEPPTFSPVREGERFFDLAMTCNARGGGIRRFIIPEPLLPSVFQDLIIEIPPP